MKIDHQTWLWKTMQGSQLWCHLICGHCKCSYWYIKVQAATLTKAKAIKTLVPKELLLMTQP